MDAFYDIGVTQKDEESVEDSVEEDGAEGAAKEEEDDDEMRTAWQDTELSDEDGKETVQREPFLLRTIQVAIHKPMAREF